MVGLLVKFPVVVMVITIRTEKNSHANPSPYVIQKTEGMMNDLYWKMLFQRYDGVALLIIHTGIVTINIFQTPRFFLLHICWRHSRSPKKRF